MLVLQRRKGESITINEKIIVNVLEAGPDWVKLAIDAPKEIPILRTELIEAANENREAAQSAPSSALEAMDKIIQGQKKNQD